MPPSALVVPSDAERELMSHIVHVSVLYRGWPYFGQKMAIRAISLATVDERLLQLRYRPRG